MKVNWVLGLCMLVNLALNPVMAQQTGEGESQNEAGQPAIIVTTTPLSEVLVKSERRVSAQVVSLNHAQISAQATGEVLGIEFAVGEQVEKGTVLVSLDCRQSELEQAMALDSLELAGKEFKRAQSLGETRLIAEQQLTQAKSTLDQARIRKRQSAIAVENCLIKAPFTGVVTRRQIQLGALATPGAPVLELLQIDRVEVEAQVNHAELLSLQSAGEIDFATDEARYRIKLRSALPLVNSMSNKRTVRLQFISDSSFAGSVGDIVWPLASGVMPVDFIVQRQSQLGYFVVDGKQARFVALEHAQMGHPARVDSEGANLDQLELIVEGRFRVEQGSSIDILN